MPHHYTKNTVRAVFWCDVCFRDTEHRIDGGRRGPCLDPDHMRKSAQQKAAPQPTEQGGLFGDISAVRKDRG